MGTIRHFIDSSKAFLGMLNADLSHVRYFVVFIGNPRSGTTLVRSLLDAHPDIVIGNEVNVLEQLVSGKSAKSLMCRILQQSNQFARQPFWEGYTYRVPLASSGSSGAATVIGDKKAGRTVRLLIEDFTLLDLLQERIPVPIRFIHCIRHPLDVITTKTRRNGSTLEWNIQQYFRLEQACAEVMRMLQPEQYTQVYLEQFIEDPMNSLERLLHFLEVPVTQNYLQACRSIVFERPNQSRNTYKWTPEEISSVEKATANCPHLCFYLNDGKLSLC